MATAVAEPTGQTTRPRVPVQVRLLRVVGWTFITAGAIVLLYLVYSLLYTNVETNAAQSDLAQRWTEEVRNAPAPAPAPAPPPAPAPAPSEGVEEAEAADASDAPGDELIVDPGTIPDADPVLDPGAAQAVIEFVRPGSDEPIVGEDPLFVVEGVSVAALRSGPGHYPGTARPGQDGNFAVAGHRTTYGAPFFSVDELVPGDEIHATGRDGIRHVYVVREQQIVTPADTWVVGPDPLGTGRPTLTLTSCHPRFSQAQRIIVFAELAA